jgi:inosine-uridine nucleoside N-ribohydrolase
MNQKTAIWLDCDAGVDRSLSIIYALAHTGVEVVGLSTVIASDFL